MDLGLEVFWRKGEKSLINVEEFFGGTGGGNWVDFPIEKLDVKNDKKGRQK